MVKWQKNRFKEVLLFIVIGMLSFLSACVSLKPHERIYLNDGEMQMNNTNQQNFQNYVQSIREGSTQAGSNKSSGGCGCN